MSSKTIIMALQLLVCLQLFHIIVTYDIANENNVKLCGRHLNIMLLRVCKNKFNTITGLGKRRGDSISLPFADDILMDQHEEEALLMQNYLALLMPTERDIQHPRNRRSPGIVDECCKKSCSFATLAQYCG